jgi:Ca2+-binding EF-hand superfamily protein
VDTATVTPEQASSSTASEDFLSIDEAFAKMDADNSGTLDSIELAQVLNHVVSAGSSSSSPIPLSSSATSSSQEVAQEEDNKLMEDLASQLVELYDANGDGVVDRFEYQSMVEDMAAVRRAQQEKLAKKNGGLFFWWDLWQFVKNSFLGRFLPGYNAVTSLQAPSDDPMVGGVETTKPVNATSGVSMTMGYITLSDLKLDLRRLLFGAVPILKHVSIVGETAFS